jgi:hypothetical protein
VNRRLFSGALAILFSFTLAQAATFSTLQNSNLLFAAAVLVTNGVPGFTNPPARLMVSAVATNSSQGGHVGLVNNQAWARRYDGPGNSYDSGSQVAVDRAGGVIVTGTSSGPGTGYDFATVKYAKDGTALWTNRYDGPGHQGDSANYLALDGADNVYAAGDSIGLGTGPDLTVIKYSSDGVPAWTNRYNSSGTNFDYPAGFAVDAAGNVVVAIGAFVEAPEFTTIKYDTV